jgi:hypothetical protein
MFSSVKATISRAFDSNSSKRHSVALSENETSPDLPDWYKTMPKKLNLPTTKELEQQYLIEDLEKRE